MFLVHYTDQRVEFLCHLEENVGAFKSLSYDAFRVEICWDVSNAKTPCPICIFAATVMFCSVTVQLILKCIHCNSFWSCRYQSSLGNKRIELFDTGNDQVAEDTPAQMASGGHR